MFDALVASVPQPLPLMDPVLVVAGVIFYLGMNYVMWPEKGAKIVRLSKFWRFVVFIHNLVLAAYSIITFINTVKVYRQCPQSDDMRDLVSSKV